MRRSNRRQVWIESNATNDDDAVWKETDVTDFEEARRTADLNEAAIRRIVQDGDVILHQRVICANGVRLHFIEAGTGPCVLLCHGFPESWYSWRHQIVALVKAGYRVIAPDMRGYGGSEAPAGSHHYTLLHLVGDMVGLLQGLGVSRAAIVGHDWGSGVALNAALMRPDMFPAVATLSIPYMPRSAISVPEGARRAGRAGFYQLYFQEPGVAEDNLGRDPLTTMRRLLWSWSGDPGEGRQWSGETRDGDLVGNLDEPQHLPAWLSADDLDFYAETFRRTGFRGALEWYRAMDLGWELLAPWMDAPLLTPCLFLTGQRDIVLSWRRQQAMDMGLVAPRLAATVYVPDAGHWVQQEAPNAVNRALLTFLADSRTALCGGAVR